MADQSSDLILIVENDPFQGNLISNQILQPAGYRTELVSDAALALRNIAELSPDLIIVNSTLPGLSGKDFLVMLRSQGKDIPVIVLVKKGAELDIIQAFRLGAADYLALPLREAEILAVIERVVKQVHARKENDLLQLQLQQTNQELKNRLRELTVISAIGKALTSTTDQSLLFERVLEGAMQISNADIGWFLLRDDSTKTYILVNHRHLPAELASNLHKPWNDGVSMLVAKSGKGISIHGEVVNRFKIASLGQALLVVPVKAQEDVIGVLVMMRTLDQAFSESEKFLLEAIADYAAISLMNARMFLAIEERLRSYQIVETDRPPADKASAARTRSINREQSELIEGAMDALDKLGRIPFAAWTTEHRQTLARLQDQIQRLIRLAETHLSGGTTRPQGAVTGQEKQENSG